MNKKTEQVPPPGNYSINRNILRPKGYKTPMMRCFTQSVNKNKFDIKNYDKIRRKLEKNEDLRKSESLAEKYTPGPGDYDADKAFAALVKTKGIEYENNNSNTHKFPTRHFMPGKRFADIKANSPDFKYDYQSDFDSDKLFGTGSVFVSVTRRNPFSEPKGTNWRLYNPKIPAPKEDFNYNPMEKWI